MPAAKRTTKPSAGGGEPQVISYRHPDKRKNNPHVGLVKENSDPGQPQTTWRYDPHINPALAFDPGRAQIENLIGNVLGRGNENIMHAALEELKQLMPKMIIWAFRSIICGTASSGVLYPIF